MSSNFFKYFEIDSTNLEAKRLIDMQTIEKTAIISSERQTNGRGRMDRNWVSIDGNMMFSLVVPEKWVKFSNVLPLSIGLLILQALKPDTNVFLKWPNDVIIVNNDIPKKCAGVLIEKYREFYIIGIGINVVSYPLENVRFVATSLKENNITVENEECFLKNLLPLLNVIPQNIIKLWNEKSYFNGKNVKINDNEGTFLGIDENANAVLMCNGRKKIITVGDVGIQFQ